MSIEEEKSNSNERRKFSRISIHKPAIIEADGKTWHAELLDISLKGVWLEKPADFPCEEGKSVNIEIELGETEKIKMKAHTAHCEGNEAGFAWDEIDIDSLDHLRRMLELNAGDSSLIERELSELFEKK
jgi:hypothetical protein